MQVVKSVTPAQTGVYQRWAAIVALLAGTATLVGEVTGIDVLTRWIATSTTMNPVTAIMLIAGSLTILIPVEHQRRIMLAVGLVMIAVGALKLVQEALGRPLGFDYLVSQALNSRGSILPDPVALNSAVTLVLLGAALFIGRTIRPKLAIAAQALAITGIAIALMALVGFVLGAATINQLTFNSMAVNSAVGLAALGMAFLALTPNHGVMRLLVYKGPSGDLARMALPICLAVPIVLGVVRLEIQNQYGISTGDGVAIMVAGNIALTLGLLWGCLILLLRSDTAVRAKAAALAISQDQYRQAGRIGKMGHWQFDALTRDLFWTNELRTLLGLTADQPANFDAMNEIIHPDDRAQAQGMMERALGAGEDRNWQLRLISGDGSVRHAKSHGICRHAPDGTLMSVLGVIADVTELEQARQGAEAASLAQANFLANMSHEIRTPLNGVLGFIDLVLDSELDPTQRRYLVLVSESAQVLLKLLNDILDLSKVEAGHIEIAPQATDLRRTIRHAARLMMPIAEQKMIALTVQIASDFPAAVVVDAGRIRQILLNLLGNALKFTDHGGVVVKLAAGKVDGAPVLRVAVVDSGVGIPPERKEAVFAAFVQADNSTSRRFGGSGLGLSISRQLADLMGGTVLLDSTPGVGTIATLTLPLVPAAAAEVEASAAAEEAGTHGSVLGVIDRGGQAGDGPERARAHLVPPKPAQPGPIPTGPGRSILLVEDIALNRELVGEMLRRMGHRVDCANDGSEAVACAARLADTPDAWDLILMDIQMPVMNGYDATRAIRALGGAAATIPIVALSANAFKTEIDQSHAAGMNDHVVKPIDFALLGRTIDHWTNSALPPARVQRRA